MCIWDSSSPTARPSRGMCAPWLPCYNFIAERLPVATWVYLDRHAKKNLHRALTPSHGNASWKKMRNASKLKVQETAHVPGGRRLGIRKGKLPSSGKVAAGWVAQASACPSHRMTGRLGWGPAKPAASSYNDLSPAKSAAGQGCFGAPNGPWRTPGQYQFANHLVFR